MACWHDDRGRGASCAGAGASRRHCLGHRLSNILQVRGLVDWNHTLVVIRDEGRDILAFFCCFFDAAPLAAGVANPTVGAEAVPLGAGIPAILSGMLQRLGLQIHTMRRTGDGRVCSAPCSLTCCRCLDHRGFRGLSSLVGALPGRLSRVGGGKAPGLAELRGHHGGLARSLRALGLLLAGAVALVVELVGDRQLARRPHFRVLHAVRDCAIDLVPWDLRALARGDAGIVHGIRNLRRLEARLSRMGLRGLHHAVHPVFRAEAGLGGLGAGPLASDFGHRHVALHLAHLGSRLVGVAALLLCRFAIVLGQLGCRLGCHGHRIFLGLVSKNDHLSILDGLLCDRRGLVSGDTCPTHRRFCSIGSDRVRLLLVHATLIAGSCRAHVGSRRLGLDGHAGRSSCLRGSVPCVVRLVLDGLALHLRRDLRCRGRLVRVRQVTGKALTVPLVDDGAVACGLATSGSLPELSAALPVRGRRQEHGPCLRSWRRLLGALAAGKVAHLEGVFTVIDVLRSLHFAAVREGPV
mmetsp:Transcript_119518/g.283764  ORF Transcript_119518/g.283764 Transcript_119518/m.283764 type:complete len:522 (+) Transcript_119518:1900-3465(+)